MATNIISWRSDILREIPNAPAVAVISAVRDAAIGFCEKTLLWTYTLARINVVAEQQDYTLTIPAAQYGTVICVDDVKYKQNGDDDDQFVTLDPLSENNKDLIDSGNWRWATGPTPSEFWMDVVEKQLHLLPIPEDNSTAGLLVRVNLKPTLTCTVVKDFLYNDFSDVLTFGALALLFGHKGMDWYDPSKQTENEGYFRTECNKAKLLKNIGATKKETRVRMRSW